jgi:hypothetical protein
MARSRLLFAMVKKMSLRVRSGDTRDHCKGGGAGAQDGREEGGGRREEGGGRREEEH